MLWRWCFVIFAKYLVEFGAAFWRGSSKPPKRCNVPLSLAPALHLPLCRTKYLGYHLFRSLSNLLMHWSIASLKIEKASSICWLPCARAHNIASHQTKIQPAKSLICSLECAWTRSLQRTLFSVLVGSTLTMDLYPSPPTTTISSGSACNIKRIRTKISTKNHPRHQARQVYRLSLHWRSIPPLLLQLLSTPHQIQSSSHSSSKRSRSKTTSKDHINHRNQKHSGG